MATAKDIARATGLSLSAVTQVLGERGHLFRPETRDRVLQAARELGYRPNSAARAVRRGRFGMVGLLSRALDAGSIVPGEVLYILQRELRERDCRLVAEQVSSSDLVSGEGVPRLARVLSVDGVFISIAHSISEQLVDFMSRSQLPAIWLNARIASDCVFPDDFGSLRDATERLLRLGHRRIALIMSRRAGAPEDHYSLADREAGYAAAMSAAGLAPQIEVLPVGDAEAFRALLAGEGRPTAILTDDGADTSGVLLHAVQAGLRVPDDLSIVALDRSELRIGGFQVDTCVLPFNKMALHAVPMLFERITGVVSSHPPRPLPYSYVAGTTCAAPGGQ
ncbi:MAG TPA: LacI family DNA-binding transcriptional regulator [Tepidisphaeraceae bacterium]|jgi:DNA-binding LacI/PurR family transcriptional regulator|nr:LacI family DNA-binding transcriptional regulator [Tepidisphaeraceae bacterium]